MSSPCHASTQHNVRRGLATVFSFNLLVQRGRGEPCMRKLFLVAKRAILLGRPQRFASLRSTDDQRLVLARHGGAGRGNINNGKTRKDGVINLIHWRGSNRAELSIYHPFLSFTSRPLVVLGFGFAHEGRLAQPLFLTPMSSVCDACFRL